MKELFEQNKVLFLAVITILIAVFLITSGSDTEGVRSRTCCCANPCYKDALRRSR